MIASFPSSEEARLATLHSLSVLDTLPEAEFDGLVEIARTVLDVPIAYVAFVDRERQWLKARQGVELCETARETALCSHTILGTEPLVVPDARLDPRFADNPLVTGPFGLRFYLGVPLAVDGQTVGTICGADVRPRTLDARQVAAMAALGRQAEALLAGRLRAMRLAESERRFDAFLSHSPAVAFLKDAEGRMRYVNRRFETMFGRPSAEVMGKTDHEWLPTEFADACARDDAATKALGRLVVEERVPVSADETQVWQTHKFAFDVEGGAWVGGIALDVTALRDAEASLAARNADLEVALRDAETARTSSNVAAARFEGLFDGLPVACFTYGEGGTIHEWNAAATALFGIGPEEALLSSIYGTVVGPEHRAAEEAVVRRVFAGETVRGAERRETMRDGRVRWLLTSTFPLRSPSGAIVGAVSANLDITRRKEAQEALHEAKLFAESMAESSTSLLYLVDFDTKTQVWSNRRVAETLGYAPDTMLEAGDELLPRIVHPDDLARMLAHGADFETAGDGQVVEFEARFRHADGSWRWLWHRETVFKRHADGRPAQIMGTAQDVTERKRMEAEMRDGEARLRTVLDALHEGVVVQDAPGGVTMWNRSAERILGVGGEKLDLQGRNDPRAAAVREDGSDFPIEERPVARAIRENRPHEAIIGVDRPGVGRRWLSVIAVPLTPAGGGPAESAVASFLDVTERRALEAEVRASEARFRTVVDSLQEGLTVQDAEGRILLWNPSAVRMLDVDLVGTRVDEGHGTRWRLLREDGSAYPPEEMPVPTALRTGEIQEAVTVGVEFADQPVRWLSVNAAPLARVDGGAATEAVSSFVDITERLRRERELREANDRLEALATTDGLTGLKNHRYFQDSLRRRIEQCAATRMPLSVALLDVDRFKAYNDDFGHPAGDAVLRGVAEALVRSVRSTDLVARYGGEEFAIVMPGLDADGALRMAERVREQVAGTPFELRSVTASFGVATLGAAQPDAEGLVRAADEALYRSKAAGRNRVTLWRPAESLARAA